MNLDRLTRLTVLLLLIVLVIGGLVLPGAAASSTSACSRLITEDWVTVDVPGFSEESGTIIDYAVSPSDPSLIYVMNGRVVLSSDDAGCSFHEVFDVRSAGLSYSTEDASIIDFDVSWSSAPLVYLAIQAFDAQVPTSIAGQELPVGGQNIIARPHVVVSQDAGTTWHEADDGLERAVGAPRQITVSPQSSAYLLVDEFEVGQDPVRISMPQQLYANGGAGTAWELRDEYGDFAVEPATSEGSPEIDGFEVDPLVPNSLWLYGPEGVLSSTDGGATSPQVVSLFRVPIGGLDVFHQRGEAPHLIAFSANQPLFFVSSNGGEVFESAPGPGVVESVDHSVSAGEFAFSTVQGNVYYVIPGVADAFDVTDPGKPIFDIQAAVSGDQQILYGRTQTTLERRAAPHPPLKEEIVDPPDPRPVLPPDLQRLIAKLEDPRLMPAEDRVVLKPGERKVLDYRLQLPGIRKVDVGFLVDLSGTMRDEIDGLEASMTMISNDLVRANFHAYFGVAAYRDYDQGPGYQRYRDIGPPDEELDEALASLEAAGGTHETALSALYQLATGAGQDDGGTYYIPSNQQFNFRSDALHVVIQATDEEFIEREHQPSFETAAGALLNVRAQQAGLAFENSEEPLSIYWTGPQRESLTRMAALTGAYAPASGVDCDGDGTVDLVPGAPLVCFVPSQQSDLAATMGAAIVEVVKALDDVRRLTLEVEGKTDVVEGVTPSSYPAVDFKLPNQLTFDVAVKCPLIGEGEYHVVPVATARGLPLAEAALTVVCGGPVPTKAAPVAVPPFLPPPPGRPPQPPQPPQVQSPVNQIQAQTQAQSQAQPQMGLVAQRQSRPQVAAVKVLRPSANLARVNGEGGDELMFSTARRARHSDLPPYLASYVLAAAMGAVFARLARARARHAYASVKVRSRR